MRRIGLTLTLLLTGPPAALAFNSFPWGAPHDQLTRAAAAEVGLSEEVTKELVRAVRDADWKETSWQPRLSPATWFRLSGNESYRAEHHFDRGAQSSHEEAFAAGVAYIREQRAEAAEESEAGSAAGAWRAIGYGLHAVQDFFSHSNWIDLEEADREALLAILLGDAEVIAPDGLKMTGYDPAADDPERPPDDPYPHRDYARDSPKKNAAAREERGGDVTAYELAFEAAHATSVRYLRTIRDSITLEQWGELDTP